MQVVVLELIPLKSLTTTHYSKVSKKKKNFKCKLWFTKNYTIRFFSLHFVAESLKYFQSFGRSQTIEVFDSNWKPNLNSQRIAISSEPYLT